jgi:transcriptional regulator
MARFPLAVLVTNGPDGMRASHLPMLYDPEPAPLGTLLTHVARPNLQWRDASDAVDALAIFCGPDAYVTPAWYEATRETGKVVPTWNYVAVHARGTLRAFDDRTRLRELVARLTANFEAGLPEPWSMDDAPGDYIDTMLGAIVGLEMSVSSLTGKWKLSQNRPEIDRQRVEHELRASTSPRDVATSEEMRRLRER